MKKKAELFYEILIQIIIISLIFGLFFMSTIGKANGRAVKQQIIEKEIALLIEVGYPGIEYSINKINMKGEINKMEIKDGKIFAFADNLASSKGYPYFTKYQAILSDEGDKFKIKII